MKEKEIAKKSRNQSGGKGWSEGRASPSQTLSKKRGKKICGNSGGFERKAHWNNRGVTRRFAFNDAEARVSWEKRGLRKKSWSFKNLTAEKIVKKDPLG